MSRLPEGWVVATLADTTQPITSIKPEAQPHTPFDYVDIGCIDNSTLKIVDKKTFKGANAPSRARRPIKDGDILFSTVRTYLRKIARVPAHLDGALTSTGVTVLRANWAAEPGYIFSYVTSPSFIESISKSQDGTMYPAVTDKDVLGHEIPLPPLAEQKRIVAKVDRLSARTTQARAALDRIPRMVERYKAEILSHEFSLALAHSGATEFSSIIRRIKAGKNLRCVECPPQQSEQGVVKVSAVTYGFFDARQAKTLPQGYIPDPDTLIQKGDFLFSRANTVELVGACAIVNEAPGNLFLSDKILRLEMDDDVKRWVYLFLRSPSGRAQLQAVSSGNQHSMRNISQKNLLRLQMPLPPIEEQREIVARIEAAFAEIDTLAKAAAAAREKLGRLDRAVLAKAFRGELVPQDPNDEPASALLERIRAAREKVVKAAPNKLGKRKKAKR